MADLVTSRVFVDGEKGITAAKLNDIVASSVIQPAFYTSKPTAGTADPTDIALILKSGAYAQVPISTLGGSATQAQIWSTRLRSFNAVGNPNFEVAQRNVGNLLTNPVSSTFVEDRWSVIGGTSMTGWTVQRVRSGLTAGGGFVLPGTNFVITNGFMRFTITAAVPVLSAGQLLYLLQFVEGSRFRELSGDVHSVSILARSSVANLNFGLVLRDPSGTRSLTKLCALGAANTPVLIQLPNIPNFPSAGNFSMQEGVQGYTLGICLACGSTNLSPANDTWQTGSFTGAAGQSNYMSNTVGSTFDLFFVQHEPGGVCSTLMDKSFQENLQESQRYFTKSYQYSAAPGSTTSAAICDFFQAAQSPRLYVPFKKTLAIVPTVTGYSASSGAINTVRDVTAGADKAITGAVFISDNHFSGFNVTSPNAAVWQCQFHYVADTGM